MRIMLDAIFKIENVNLFIMSILPDQLDKNSLKYSIKEC